MSRTLLALTALTATACLAKTARFDDFALSYNEALQRAQEEQLLLNIVRFAYGETPMFLQPASVATSLTYSVSASAGVNVGVKVGSSDAAGAPVTTERATTPSVGVSGSWSSSPTVTWTPLGGEAFTKRLLSEVSVDNLALLLRQGWRASVVLSVFVERIGAARNDPTTARDAYCGFRHHVDAAEARSEAGQDVLTQVVTDAGALVDVTAAAGLPTYTVESLAELEAKGYRVSRVAPDGLTVERPDARRWALATTTDEARSFAQDAVHADAVTLRSLSDAMFELGYGVDAPDLPGHGADVLDLCTPDAPAVPDTSEGRRTAHRAAVRSYFRVESSATCPSADVAAVAVRHRGRCYWIADDDRESKRVFSVVHTMYELQSAAKGESNTLFTLPLR